MVYERAGAAHCGARVVGLASVITFALATHGGGQAHAFCRTHTNDPPTSSCPAVCTSIGVPLRWTTREIAYAFNERGVPGLSFIELSAIFERAFDAWRQVSCEGENIGFSFRQLAETTAQEEEPARGEHDLNTIVHYDAQSWVEHDHSRFALAVTMVEYFKNGELRGADILLNGGLGPFGDCSDGRCGEPGRPNADLQNVATHEIGHLLGLAHSEIAESTMACDADAGELGKRTLEPDDIAGLCDIYPPGEAFVESDSGGRCGVAGAAEGGLWFAAWLLALRRRRLSA